MRALGCGPKRNWKRERPSVLLRRLPLRVNSTTKSYGPLLTALSPDRLVEEPAKMSCVSDAGGEYSSGPTPTPTPAVLAEMVRMDFAGISEVGCSSYPGSTGGNSGIEEEAELELGLSLGTKKAVIGGKRSGGKPRGEYCQILTAEDLPSMRSRASPLSSSSSVSSSSSPTARESRKTANKPPGQTVVGWPPIGAYRMDSLVNRFKDNTSSHAVVTTTHYKTSQNIKNNESKESICRKVIEGKGRSCMSSLFVKVNMDGDPIGRKVNLNSHLSYETLALALEAIFFKPTLTLGGSTNGPKTSMLLDGSLGFALTYEDKDGDWMLAGDVPWGMFLNTVKRLRIMRTSDASGLGKLLQPTLMWNC